MNAPSRSSSIAQVLLVVAASLIAAPVRPSSAAGCVAGPDRVCVRGGRFQVVVHWFGTPASEGAPAVDAGDASEREARVLGTDAGYFRAPGGSAVVVQIVDGRSVNGHFWVLVGADASASYDLAVTDLATGVSRDYSELKQTPGAASDLLAFAEAGGSGAPVAAPAETPSPAGGSRLVLLAGGRLRVAIDGPGQSAGAIGHRSGVFWSEDAARPDVVVSVVDGRTVDGSQWLLYASPAGDARTLRWTDTSTWRTLVATIAAGDGTTHLVTRALLAPTSVSPTLDRSRAVRATVASTGATLTAKSANGTVFTLAIPAGALLGDETITMTPVVAIARLPFHPGLVAAVHLEPEGLRLFRAATLRIQPPVAVPRAQETTFAYRGNGQELFLFPPSANAAGVELKILHFSGYGVAKGSLGEQAAQLLRLPTRAEDRLSQKLQAIVSRKRRGGKAASLEAAPVRPLDYAADLEQVLRDAFKTSIRPVLTTVTTSCAALKKQTPILLGWSRQVQLLGLDTILPGEFGAQVAAIFDALVKGTANCYDEAFGKCVAQHDPNQIVPMFSALRQLELLGGEDLVDPGRIEKCLRFDLDFETDVEYHSIVPNPFGVSAGYRMKLRTRVPLRFDGLKVSGEAPLEWSSATWTGVLPAGVTVAFVGPGHGSNFAVAELGFDLNVYEGPPPPPQIRLSYEPGEPVVRDSFTFDGDPPTTIPFPDFAWRPVYGFLHQDESQPSGGGPILARDWSPVGGAVWARKSYQRSRSNAQVKADEVTLMDLIHTPGS